jgi:hypothetical protein
MSKSKSDWKEDRIILIIGFFACIGFVIYTYLFQTKDKTDITENELTAVYNLVLTKEPVVEKIKSKEYIKLNFLGYEKNFSISEYDVNPTSKIQIVKNIHKGDTVSVGMTKEEYENINNYGLFDRNVEINSLQKKGEEYLNITVRNFKYSRGYWDAIPALIYAAIMCLFFAGFSTKPKYSPTLVISIGAIIIIIIKSRYF